jgi:hypothetical protein
LGSDSIRNGKASKDACSRRDCLVRLEFFLRNLKKRWRMLGILGNKTGSSKMSLIGICMGMLLLLCIAVAPSASAQTYTVNITGGSGPTSGCSSGTGTLTIGPGNSLEFTSTNGCYFGAVGYEAGPATQCLTNCSDLSTLPSGTTITFQGSNVGACSANATADCSVSHSTEGFNLEISSAGFLTTSSSGDDELVLGSTGQVGGFKPPTVEFDDAVLVTPEPASYLLFGSGLLALGGIFRKKLGLSRPV